MRILLLNDDFPPIGRGGSATVVQALARGYRRAGHDATVLTTHQSTEPDYEEVREGLRVISLQCRYRPSLRPYLSLRNPSMHSKLRHFFGTEDTFDVAHAHNVHGFLTYDALRQAKRFARRTAITYHDVMSFSYGRLSTAHYLASEPPRFDYRLSWADQLRQAGLFWNPWRNIAIRRILRGVTMRISVSQALRDALTTNGVPVDTVIANGLDPQETQVSESIAEDLRHRWHVHNKRIVFFGGRLSRDKGIGELLRAFGMIMANAPDARVLIVGDRRKAEGLLRDVPSAVHQKLIVTGWLDRPELLAAMAMSQVCVTPSACFDSFPTVNLEAMALGKPVIATWFGGSPEQVIDGETGYIVNPFDTDTLAARLLSLLTDATLARRMGSTGHRRFLEHFGLERQVQAYLRLFAGASQ